MEVLPHASRDRLEQHAEDKDAALVRYDVGNAHNEVDRDKFLTRMQVLTPGPSRFLEWMDPTDSAVAVRVRKLAMRVCFALAQARRARVPLVVVEMSFLPATISAVYSRGELPRSNAVPLACAAVMRSPSRSPQRRASGCCAWAASASSILATGRMASAPLAEAVTMLEVARRMSNTTQVV